MKTVIASLATVVCSVAQAGGIALKPYLPSPFPNAPFSNETMCHVQSYDTSGLWLGVCHYTGYYNNSDWAVVSWNTLGTPLMATRCFLYSFQGSPVCPAQTYGPFEYLQGVPVFVQAKDTAGNTAVIVDKFPRYSAIITP